MVQPFKFLNDHKYTLATSGAFLAAATVSVFFPPALLVTGTAALSATTVFGYLGAYASAAAITAATAAVASVAALGAYLVTGSLSWLAGKVFGTSEAAPAKDSSATPLENAPFDTSRRPGSSAVAALGAAAASASASSCCVAGAGAAAAYSDVPPATRAPASDAVSASLLASTGSFRAPQTAAASLPETAATAGHSIQ